MAKSQLSFLWIATISSIFFGCKKELESKEKFHGMWRLDRHEVKDSVSGTWSLDSARMGLTGLLIYDGLGHMGVQQMKAPGNISESNIDIVYFANYSLLKNNVIQHTKRSSNFDDVGDSVRRGFEFKEDTLLLTPEEAGGRLRIRWIKMTKR